MVSVEWRMPKKECSEINPERALDDTRDHRLGFKQNKGPRRTEQRLEMSLRPTWNS